MKSTPSIVVSAGALACLVIAGCVVEETPRTGLHVPRMTNQQAQQAQRAQRESSSSQVKRSAQPVALPSGPIASPATSGKTTMSEVAVGVVPMGVVRYDGQTLPMVSPDGQFVVVQEGEAPAWEAILSEPKAEPPMGSGIAVYAVGEKGLSRVEGGKPFPTGLVLGRGADDQGFLVEAPQTDGSRWIGRAKWMGGVEWLARGPMVHAHGVFTPKGEVVFTRRAVESDRSELVVVGKDGRENVRPAAEGSYEYPMCTGDLSLVYALHLGASGIELEAIRLDRVGGENGAARFGATVSHKVMQPKAELLMAHQIAMTAQPAMPARSGVIATDQALSIFNPRINKMTVFRLESGTFEPLATGSMAAAASQDAGRPGYYCATMEGMMFYPLLNKPGEGPTPTVRVLASPYVPRRVYGTPESMILFGPVKGRADELEVVRLVLGPVAEKVPQN